VDVGFKKVVRLADPVVLGEQRECRTKAGHAAFSTQSFDGPTGVSLGSMGCHGWCSRFCSEGLMLQLAPALRAKRWISPRQVYERLLPGLESRDVHPSLLGARAPECFAGLQQVVFGCTCVESVVSNLLEALWQNVLQKAAQKLGRRERNGLAVLGRQFRRLPVLAGGAHAETWRPLRHLR
jgi:hypothetical protein